ncbi:hypothetical protein [Catenuloplanes atrovinosus]|uniref:Uncharacterized protein n=1 Tax=Catenuloplanes atrovinosus TaxID=137266 RepID=A0AAE4CAN0_9ACTN|nr:hypothetical protein [Catenuloplanes atrovinosus]MDR7277182.1 hypothetical protein [Catenuloplanes atrovinosus]
MYADVFTGDPRWQAMDAPAARAASPATGGRSCCPPPNSPPPRRRRRAGSLRHLAEVIRTHRMAPGMAVDKDVVAGVLAGDLRYLTDPVPVVAVARASHHIVNLPFGDDDVQRLTVAVAHLKALLAAAHESDRRAPYLLPVPRPASALVERDAGLSHAAPADQIQLAWTPIVPTADTPPRRASTWLRPAAWVALLAIFAVGVLVGAAGSRLASSRPIADPTRPVAEAPARNARSACQSPGPSRPAGPVIMGAPGTPSGESIKPNWWANVLPVELRHTPTGFSATVPTGSTLPQEFLVARSGITMITGHRYRFDFTVTSDRPLDILLRIQDKTPPHYRPSLVESVPIGRTACRYSFTFTAAVTSHTTGEVTFQLGGQGAYTVRVDDAVLVEIDS